MNVNDKIYQLWDLLGYTIYSKKGICHSLTIRWIEAALLGQLEQFYKRKEMILELDISSFANAILQIKAKTKNHESLNLEEINQLNFLAYLESMFIFQMKEIQNMLLGFSRLRDVDKISEIASTEEIYRNGGLLTFQLELGSYSKTDLQFWLERYEDAIKKMDTPDNIFVFSLCNETHTIGIKYQKNTGTWQVEDLRNIEICHPPSKSRQEVSDQIFIAFILSIGMTKYYLQQLKNFRNKLQEVEEQAKLENTNKQIIYSSDFFNIKAVYYCKTKKWISENNNQALELDVIADYMVLSWMGFKNLSPYINMMTIIYLTAHNEHLYGIIDKFQQRLVPYDFSNTWLARPNIIDLIKVATDFGHTGFVKKLITLNLYDEQVLSDAIFTSAQENDIDIFKLLLALPESIYLINQLNHYGTTPLIIACYNGHFEIAKMLLDLGADPNIQNIHDQTPLELAADRGYLEIVNLLVNKKAILNKQSIDGATPLSLAVCRNHVEVVKKLIDAGADVNLDHPLGTAAQKGYLEIINMLIDGKVIIDKQGFNGATALNIAAECNHIEVVTTLIKAGADLNIPNHRGITPLKKAVNFNHLEIANLLRLEMNRRINCPLITGNLTNKFFGLKNPSGNYSCLNTHRHLIGYS